MPSTMFDQSDALLVIDMQNSFLKPDGVMYGNRGAPMIDIDSVVEANVRAIELANSRALPVIYTRHCYRPGYVDAGAHTRRLVESLAEKPLLAGSWDAAVIDELAAPSDAVFVDKTRMDAFVGTDLELMLRGLGASRLILAGVVTNACVETTTRSAAMRDFEVTILADCCTTYSREHQESSLGALEYYMFATIGTLGDASAA